MVNDDERLSVEFVDSSGSNYYEPGRKTIVLDRRLLDYDPEVLEHVLRHELYHVAYHIRGEQYRDLWHDIQEDLYMSFSKSCEARKVRRYLSEVSGSGSIEFVAANLIRGALSPFIGAAGWIYRKVVR